MSALRLDQGPRAAIKEERDWRLIILPSRAGSSLNFSQAHRRKVGCSRFIAEHSQCLTAHSYIYYWHVGIIYKTPDSLSLVCSSSSNRGEVKRHGCIFFFLIALLLLINAAERIVVFVYSSSSLMEYLNQLLKTSHIYRAQ